MDNDYPAKLSFSVYLQKNKTHIEMKEKTNEFYNTILHSQSPTHPIQWFLQGLGLHQDFSSDI